MFDLNGFLASSKRIFLLSRKPSWKDYQTMAKITGLGIIAIGLIGFAVIFTFKFLRIGS